MTVLMLVIIGVVIALIVTLSDWHLDWVDKLVMSIVNSIIGCLLGFMVGFIISVILPMDLYDKKYSYELEALQDGSYNNGRFFLGCGTIDGKMKYVWYWGKDGIYEMQQIETNLVKIKYTDGKATVNVTEIEATDSWINDWAIDLDLHDKTYLLEVPKGTIKQNYSLDAQ